MSEVTAVGFVPAAPLLVPAVAGGSADLDAELRDACRAVVRTLCASGPDAVVVVAGLRESGSWPSDGTWSFDGFGVPRVGADDRPRLPWPLGIGAWLLDDAGCACDRGYVTVPPDAAADVATGPSRIAVLAVGDGSARRTEKAPGFLDERAEPFDATIAHAIRDGDVAALADLDPGLAAELLCAGAPVWRWVMRQIGVRAVTGAELLADTAPYGVGYFAGWWRLGS
jgi:hypothetical protein